MAIGPGIPIRDAIDRLIDEITRRLNGDIYESASNLSWATASVAVANPSTSSSVTMESLRETLASIPDPPAPPPGSVWFARGTVRDVFAGIPDFLPGHVPDGFALHRAAIVGLDVVQVGRFVLIGDRAAMRKALDRDIGELLAALRDAEMPAYLRPIPMVADYS